MGHLSRLRALLGHFRAVLKVVLGVLEASWGFFEGLTLARTGSFSQGGRERARSRKMARPFLRERDRSRANAREAASAAFIDKRRIDQ